MRTFITSHIKNIGNSIDPSDWRHHVFIAVFIIVIIFTVWFYADIFVKNEKRPNDEIWFHLNGRYTSAKFEDNIDYVPLKPNTIYEVWVNWGEILTEPPIVGGYNILQPEELIFISIPGLEGDYKLAKNSHTEIIAPKPGEMKFKIVLSEMFGTYFASGEQKRNKFIRGPVKIAFQELSQSTGKAVPPIEINETKVAIKMPKELIIKNQFPDFNLSEELKKSEAKYLTKEEIIEELKPTLEALKEDYNAARKKIKEELP
ncbi:hypothetical protein KAR28_05220 [Candidatus Parcubacteria bacterium]|nr:hypothetical protein [Candidatus Parcubacteria bacterium]